MAGRHLLPCLAQPTFASTGVSNVRSAHLGTEVPQNRFSSDGASTSGRHQCQEPVWQRSQRRCCISCSVAAPGREQEAIQLEVVPSDGDASPKPTTSSFLCDPESFSLDSGQLSTVNQEASQRPEDIFRCSGCSLQGVSGTQLKAYSTRLIRALWSSHLIALAMTLMQGPTGCAQMLWRNSLDGYLRQILNARVYDVAVRA